MLGKYVYITCLFYEIALYSHPQYNFYMYGCNSACVYCERRHQAHALNAKLWTQRLERGAMSEDEESELEESVVWDWQRFFDEVHTMDQV